MLCYRVSIRCIPDAILQHIIYICPVLVLVKQAPLSRWSTRLPCWSADNIHNTEYKQTVSACIVYLLACCQSYLANILLLQVEKGDPSREIYCVSTTTPGVKALPADTALVGIALMANRSHTADLLVSGPNKGELASYVEMVD